MADYVTLEELKAWLRIDDDVDNDELSRAITTASHEIDHLCSRTFEVAVEPATARYFEPWYDKAAGRWILPVDDFFDDSGLLVDLWNPADEVYDDAVNGYTVVRKGAGTTIVLPGSNNYSPAGQYDQATSVRVTALWGWPSIPPGVQSACLLLATQIFKRRESAFGLISTLDGSEQTRLTRTMDPNVIAALRGYIKYWAVR